MKYLILLALLTACGPQQEYIKGEKGDAGTPGKDGSTGPTGPQGPTGPTGATGSIGLPGVNGTNGSNGQNGTNGTVITPIRFCPGPAPTYPSIFPEYGIKIGTNIYAVYSIPNAFLTLVIPGHYSSTGIGSNCSFTLHLDGSITY